MAQALADLTRRLESLPDNPRVRRLPGGRAFVLPSRHLGRVWAPYFHDFAAQRLALVALVGRTSPDKVPDVLKAAVASGKVATGNGSRGALALHPEIIKALSDVLAAL